MSWKLRVLVLAFALLLILPSASAYQVPERGVIYQVMVDRFYDGNQSNNEPFYDPDHVDYRMYWGGDIEGLIEKLDYIKSLGVTMIWVSPLNDNINTMAYGSAPYHGYWTRDYKRIEEHFGDWMTFKKLVEEAEKKGICIIVDFVPNHSNPATAGKYGSLYDNGTRVADYLHDAQNAVLNPYTGSKDGIYHHNGNIKEWYGFQLKYANLYDLADFNQLNPFVDSYLKESASLFVDSGVCGFRIDAVKHMDLGWLETFYLSLYREKPLFIYGEYYLRSPEKTDDLFHFYRYSNTTSLLSIPIRETISRTFAYGGDFRKVSKTLEEYYSRFIYPNKAVNFLDSHDLVRFLNENPSRDRFHMALALTMTLPGIPVIYYGDESYLVSRDGKGDPYNRPMMVFNNATEAARIIRTLAELRKTNDALAFGDLKTLHAEYHVWVFERDFGNHSILVAVNKFGSEKKLMLPLNWPDGTYVDSLYGSKMDVTNGTAELSLPPARVLVFHREGSQNKPLIGSITPYMAEPGDRVVLAGRAFGKGGEVFVNGIKGKVISWENDTVEFVVPKLATNSSWVDVWLETPRGETNKVKLRYYTGNEVPSLIALKTNSTGFLWIRGNIPELAEPRPLLKSSTGYYFTVAPLPEGKAFQVELYEGLPWDKLQPTGEVYHGTGNRTVVLQPGKIPSTSEKPTQSTASSPSTSSKTETPLQNTSTTTATEPNKGICGPALMVLIAMAVLLGKREKV